MAVRSRLSWPKIRSTSAHRAHRGHRGRRSLSPLGFGDWLLEDRCLLSIAPSQMTSGLSLVRGQTEVIDVSTTPVLTLNGDFNNQGTIYLVSTNPLVNSVSISAQNIIDWTGALLTTVLPSGGLPGYQNAINNLSLALVASENIVNDGTITSAGNLTALAGGSITNAPGAGAPSGEASVQAVAELNLLSASVANQGVVSSTAGDVDIAVPSMYASAAAPFGSGSLPGVLPQNININNSSGTMRALEGTINFGGAELGQSARLDLTGGGLAALAINVQAGKGAIEADVNDVAGAVNVSGGSAHFTSDSSVLDLGSLDVAGDPTFFNMGDIEITGDIMATQSLAILATGSIFARSAVLIEATNPQLGGQNVYIVAGALLQPVGSPAGSGTIPPEVPLMFGQSIQVVGGNENGGTISLANTTIDTDATTADQSGGNVTLVAFGGSGTGGITGVNITTGGMGGGNNGSVNTIAGGTVGSNGPAISGITINTSGGTGMALPTINISAALPMIIPQSNDFLTFDATGVTGGQFLPGILTPEAISLGPPPVLGGEIFTDGGTVLIQTGGSFSNQSVVRTSGSGLGRNAGNITIVASSISVAGPLLANGDTGSGGESGGVPGAPGQNGGNGGMITLKGSGGISIDASIQANAGSGGNGGNAAVSGGGAGGRGGNGGMAGTISLTTNDAQILQYEGSSISASGGNGGNGGSGGAGGATSSGKGSVALFRRLRRGGKRAERLLKALDSDSSGGAGGDAGVASAGGSLSASAGAGSITFNGVLNFNGGNGGVGGGGGNGGDAILLAGSGGSGGATGISQSGGMGGTIELQTTSGAISLATVVANGGAGGSQTAQSGSGGKGLRAGVGGAIDNAGYGGDGGKVLIIPPEGVLPTTGNITVTGSIQLSGGAGGMEASKQAAGKGGKGTGLKSRGGDGGSVRNGGDGGVGGVFKVSTAGNVTLSATDMINADGGAGGLITSAAGEGGSGPLGGDGGGLGHSGGGGDGGGVSITSSDGYVIISNTISAEGGAGGTNSGTGGAGGMATADRGGAGGSVGAGVGGSGPGGKGGSISISSGSTAGPIDSITVPISIFGQLLASGGAGGDLSAKASGGAGGEGKGKASGGSGGSLLGAGGGGPGGSVTISGKDSININNSVNIAGGAGGGMKGTGGKGGHGPIGGGGGGLGSSGSGGGGGGLMLSTSQIPPNRPSSITVQINAIVNAGGGAAGVYTGTAGNGASGSDGKGGDGGALANQGSGGGGGLMLISGLNLQVNGSGALLANGGDNGEYLGQFLVTPGYAGTSGFGGNGGTVGGKGKGGDGGLVGNAGSGGGGGTIGLDFPGTITVNERQIVGFLTVDSIAARGGLVSDDDVKSGNGGNAGAVAGAGGRSGNIGNNGSGGKGGTIIIQGGAGDMSGTGVVAAAGGKVEVVAAHTGSGGNAGMDGAGGASGMIGDNGNAGKGGNIIISSTSGNLGLSVLIAAGGDVDGTFKPVTGNGGNGGETKGPGGASGQIGNNGNGGAGGIIKESSESGNIGAVGLIQGKFESFIAAGGVVAPIVELLFNNVPYLNLYAPSQARTGAGGLAFKGNGGDSGDIGTNGSGGDGGEVDLTTGSGNLNLPTGAIVTAGGDGGTAFDQTGNGGSTGQGVGGKSGDIGRNSNGGNAGPITLSSTSGTISVASVLILRGAIASNSADHTGRGGNSSVDDGGKSGQIGTEFNGVLTAGGAAGNGGTLSITAGGSITTSEAIIATGGDAGALSPAPPPGIVPPTPSDVYFPVTGSGGRGGTGGGDSGSIGIAGIAGKGGSVSIGRTPGFVPPAGTPLPMFELDRMIVSGGGAGTVLPVPPKVFTGYSVIFPAGDGEQLGKTGTGGTGGAGGGSAGSVGGGVVGGGGGMISVISPGSIRTVQDFANGGSGGDQAAQGGAGGQAVVFGDGGNGGSVGGAGNGGDAGSITIKAQNGISLRQEAAFGGNGGNVEADAKAGNGGKGRNADGEGNKGGNVGYVGDASDMIEQSNGGAGGSLTVANLALNKTIMVTAGEANALDFHGGNGGSMQGSAGKGGNATVAAKIESMGGAGGNCLKSGAGAHGGSIDLESPGDTGSVELMGGATVDGGDDGFYTAKSGDGGSSTLNKTGGKGGDSGGQNNAGGSLGGIPVIMNIKILAGTFTQSATAIISADGGDALYYINKPGNGGSGGGRGGAGGDGGRTGSGGDGGTIYIATTENMIINGVISASGGARTVMSVTSGNGGDAGAKGGGGNAGTIQPAGSAGAAGSISLESMFSNVSGTGSVIADGGNVNNQATGTTPAPMMIGGTGGKGGEDGKGGDGGSAGAGPGAAITGGKISVSALSGISLAYYEANGGSVIGAFTAVGGKGGNDALGGLNNTGGGAGGSGGNNGSGGNGGDISLATAQGNIDVARISAIGGSVGDMTAIAGNGGNQENGGPDQPGPGRGMGGAGGSVGDNGSGGKGGSIEISLGLPDQPSKGTLTATDVLNVDGGSVGVYDARSGNGGNGGEAKGAGGPGGKLGNNGRAGGGNEIKITGSNGAVTLQQALLADGGSVGAYTAKGGHGGNANGNGADDVGGAGEITGNNGTAGGGGTIDVESRTGLISTLLVSASGGSASSRQGTAGDGGSGGKRGGVGGIIGGEPDDKTEKRPAVGTAGGNGGEIGISSMFGGVTLNGDVIATGSAGGAVTATAGAGGFGTAKGLPGGAVAPAGSGGIGGLINISAATTLTLVGSRKIVADAGAGGDQSGTGGKGGDSNKTDGLGGKGGDVDQPGNGGMGRTITIIYTNLKADQPTINATANGGKAGHQAGTEGAAGDGFRTEGAGSVDRTPPTDGADGTVDINPEVQLK